MTPSPMTTPSPFDPNFYISQGGPAGNPSGLIPGHIVSPNLTDQSRGVAYGVVQSDLTVTWFNASGAPINPATFVGGGLATPPVFSNALVGPIPMSLVFSAPGYVPSSVPVGATFTVQLGNLPEYIPVTVSGTVNGMTFPSYVIGESDTFGNLIVSGTMPDSPGAWHEIYSLPNGSVIGFVDFTIVPSNQAIAGSPTQTAITPLTLPKTASNQTSPTTLTTQPPDTRGTGYGTMPAGAGLPKLSFALPGYPTTAVPSGAGFTISIAGAPAGAQITVDVTINGAYSGRSVAGTADANGNLAIIGTMPAAPAGTWHEDYSVSGSAVPFGSIDFTIIGGSSAALGQNVYTQAPGARPAGVTSPNFPVYSTAIVGPGPSSIPTPGAAGLPILVIVLLAVLVLRS